MHLYFTRWYRWVQFDIWIPYWYIGVGAEFELHWQEPRFHMKLMLAPLLAFEFDLDRLTDEEVSE